MYFSNTLEKVLADAIHIRVFKILSLHSGGLTGRAIGSMAQTSPFKINQVLRNLVSQGVVLESVVGKAHLYRLNQDHILVQQLINPAIEFEKTLLSNLGKNIMKQLKPKPLSIMVYGSVARGDEKPTSDIDLFLIFEKQMAKETIDFHLYGNPISIKSIQATDFRKRFRNKDSFIQNIVKEGKCIAGMTITELLET